MSTKAPAAVELKISKSARIGIVAARFNEEIVGELLDGCVRRFAELGVERKRIVIERVPGAFELPLAAKAMCRSKKFAAVVCLGAVIRGETPHFDYIAGECARGIAEVSRDEMLPVIFGVLTTNNQKQARDRIGRRHGHAGERAADAAMEMIGVLWRLRK